MGTEKRERQKAGRAARVEAAVAAQKRAQSRRRVLWIVGTVVFAVVVIGIAALLLRDDDSNETASTTTTRPSTSTSAAAASVEGQPCVEFADTLPPGAPAVPIVAGPPPTELQTTDLVEGTGEVVPEGATVTVDYIGVSCSTGMIFDSSYSRGEPATFPLDGVIEGWTKGIPGMKVGGQRLLVIPPAQAYGDTGAPGGGIAPGETLWFVVDVKGIGADTSAPGG